MVKEFRIGEARILTTLIITAFRVKYPSAAPCFAEEK
jgi:hypothetical protein